MRIAVGIEYDGTGFNGWQAQSGNARTVQGVLEQAIAQVADHPVVVHCAGRTDAGVHAIGQVVHFDTQVLRPLRSWVMGCNSNLPKDVGVQWVAPVDDEFHARFSAIGRHYRYVIANGPVRKVLARWQVAWTHRPLDEMRMQDAALHLIGTHDFSSYRAMGCQAKHPVRTLKYIKVQRYGELIIIRVGADAFLYHMVRNIVGVLMTIGRGERPITWALDLLNLKDRTRGGVTAPSQGLCLTKVDYPPNFALPFRNTGQDVVTFEI